MRILKKLIMFWVGHDGEQIMFSGEAGGSKGKWFGINHT